MFSDRRDAFFPGLMMILIAIALAGLVLARQVLVQRELLSVQGQLRHQAFHDVLTGLPNRLLVVDRAEQLLARARRDRVAVPALFLDLDGFKHLNDTYGHAVGDKLLQTVASRITNVIREGDTVGRLGGDEFVILLDPATLTVTPELVAERVLASVRAPIRLDGPSEIPLSISASIGITSGHHSSADGLLHDADIALYRAKEEGKDRCVVYESGMDAVAEERFLMELDLREAIEQRQLFLVYQPILNLQSKAVTGVEALIRWRHSTRGVIVPDEFIPIAETSGMIIPIGRWVLAEACLQAAEWHRSGSTIGIAVNVSGRQLASDQLLEVVNDALSMSGLDPGTLTLEITETHLMNDPDAAAKRLASLKEIGVRIAIDDFGTGYSSLDYLRKFPVDAIKIDRSFISGIATSSETAAIVASLIQLGKTLGLEILGEGIEEPDQLRRLQRDQCDLGQGFLLGRPLDVEGIERFFEETSSYEQPVPA